MFPEAGESETMLMEILIFKLFSIFPFLMSYGIFSFSQTNKSSQASAGKSFTIV